VSNHQRQLEKTLEEEVEEKKRMMPSHLHVSVDTLDSVYMTTSMFLEIPALSDNRFALHTKVQHRNFRKLIEQYDLKGIQFVPSSNRDFIVAAARNLH
jgi:translation initiation factor 3 subunit C